MTETCTWKGCTEKGGVHGYCMSHILFKMLDLGDGIFGTQPDHPFKPGWRVSAGHLTGVVWATRKDSVILRTDDGAEHLIAADQLKLIEGET
jgi:hypothetical protein